MSNFIPYRCPKTRDLFWLKDRKRGLFICLSLRCDDDSNFLIPQQHMVIDNLQIFEIEDLPRFTNFDEKNLSEVLNKPFAPY